ncbi:MAG: hypothetical protein AAGI63_11560 [Planctomycetota bacterium]
MKTIGEALIIRSIRPCRFPVGRAKQIRALPILLESTIQDYKIALAGHKQHTRLLRKYAERRYGKGHDRFKFLHERLLDI